jgi:hypothetical protein
MVAANSPNPSVGEGGLQAVLDMAAWADTKSLDPKAAEHGGSHVGGALGAGDPLVHYGPGAWLL